MKKIAALFVMIAAVAAGSFAAGARDSATVEGKLVMAGNVPTVVSGGTSYLLPAGPFYELAWRNGIKAGDTLKIEGLVGDALTDAEAKDNGLPAGAKPIAPTKVWVNGKELSLSDLSMGRRAGGRGFGPGACYGFSDDDDRGYGMRGGRGSAQGNAPGAGRGAGRW